MSSTSPSDVTNVGRDVTKWNRDKNAEIKLHDKLLTTEYKFTLA